MAQVVAIVGRPNVGKSTLFNRLVEKKQAIMDDRSGVTRDRHYGLAEWNGRTFTVIDTGGYVTGSVDIFEKAIRNQVEIAIREADFIFFMVDTKTGLIDLDQEFASILRSAGKPVFVIANKSDNHALRLEATEFYALGFDNIYPVSSTNGSGTGELLDDLVNAFEPETGDKDEENIPRVSILGRPNVGKSSLLNILLGEERSIVTEIAGTTRDSINSHYNLYGKNFILIDTAGIRKKTKVRDNIEFYSVMRSIKALQDSDVCLIMIDATLGLEGQDMNLISLANRYKKGILLLVNKWDLIEKDTATAQKFKKEVDSKLGPLSFVPILFISALNKQRIFQVVEKSMEIYENRQRKIPTSALNKALLPLIEKYPPPAVKGKYIKIKYITQLPTETPTFAFFCNHPQYIQVPYERYLMNNIREQFDFSGVPIKVIFRNK
ncbi:MAG: ribosome biogenesis GTPase Der [Cyclobacteriaceae bacterium]|nr:ribosome biogenesis GTPase Der [Cyclobacteriaceae bacterium]